MHVKLELISLFSQQSNPHQIQKKAHLHMRMQLVIESLRFKQAKGEVWIKKGKKEWIIDSSISSSLGYELDRYYILSED